MRPDGQPGYHFVVNEAVRLWLTCCVDEVIAEILTVPGLRKLMTGSQTQVLKIAIGTNGSLNYLEGVMEEETGLLDPRCNTEANGQVARLGALAAKGFDGPDATIQRAHSKGQAATKQTDGKLKSWQMVDETDRNVQLF